MYKNVLQAIPSNNGNWKHSKYWTIKDVLSAWFENEKEKASTKKIMKSLIIPLLWNKHKEIAEQMFPSFLPFYFWYEIEIILDILLYDLFFLCGSYYK